jgi:dienelactone hydrolase
MSYLRRITQESGRRYACTATSRSEFDAWQAEARPALCRLIGLERIELQCGGHTPRVELGEAEVLGGYARQACTIETEPDVTVPFYLLGPEGDGPFPLALTPHGHGEFGSYAGVAKNEHDEERIHREDHDVAVQAAKRGYLAIAPATRGLGCPGVPDDSGRYGGKDCRSQVVHAVMAGRTAVGERVWDMQRLLDWATQREDVAGNRVLMLGNSGGGVVTTYTAACDTRVSLAVPSCSFTLLVRRDGRAHHCDCNTVPGIFTFGDLYDVAGLIAPRPLLVLNGREDPLFINEDVEVAFARLRPIYDAADASERLVHRWGPAGHRFYGDLIWDFVDAHVPSA